jgi:uncharacterized protein with ParB-like and HNH nuclease domain
MSSNNNTVQTVQNPRLKSIAEFLDGKHHFFIPYYQRGYRWEERQIVDLLDDILEFQNNIKNKEGNKSGEFYCLQPIVVLKRDDNSWEVIDGQQRLTTIFILLSYLRTSLKILRLPTSIFSIEYETREKGELSSKLFLEDITNVSGIDKRNIDFYRMSNAFLIIKKWFEDNDSINIGDFCNTLLKIDYNTNAIDNANNVRFIWYELNAGGDKPNIAFAKYNRGKIDLTNAELIKAMFYLYDNPLNDAEKKKHQLKIGYEWDDIENNLRKKDFWKFLNPKKTYTNHIEFIFELIARKYLKEIGETKLNIDLDKDRFGSFYVFNELVTSNRRIYPDDKYDNTKDFLWDEVKTYYRTFVEWYNDDFYYHIIGFLRQIEQKIETIKEQSESFDKKQFKQSLKDLVKERLGEIDFEQLGYDDERQKAQRLLLLFNVITTMNSDYRFTFDKFSEGKWSLEHIHAQQSERLNSDKQRRALLNEQKQYFSNDETNEFAVKIDELLTQEKIDAVAFNKIQDDIFDKYSDNSTVNSIKNLTLLTVSDNSCLNNNIFPVKRDLIKKLDEKGSFIPICTKNVFLKYYSEGVEQNVKWDIADMDAYLAEIKRVLNDYIKIKD